MKQVLVVEVDLVATPAEVVAKMTTQIALGGEVGCERSYRHVVSIDRDEGPVIIGLAWVQEAIAVEIIASGCFALIVQPAQQREIFGYLIDVVGAASGNCAELALPDQSLSEVRIQRQIVGAKEARNLQLLAATEPPDIVQRQERAMRLVLLPRVNGVAEIGDLRSEGILGTEDRDQPRNIGLAVISDTQQSEPVLTQMK